MEAQLLKVLLLQLKLKNNGRAKKITVLNISRRKTTTKSKVIVNHTLKLLLKKSTLKACIDMIQQYYKILIVTKTGLIQSFEMTGHANFAEPWIRILFVQGLLRLPLERSMRS